MLLITSLAAGLGCNFVTQALRGSPEIPPATPTALQPTPLPETSSTTAPESAPAGEQPAGASITSNPASAACVSESELGALEASYFDEYPAAIRDYLNEGATPAELGAALARAGVASMPTAVAAGDLTGDEVTDLAVSIFNPQGIRILPEGMLLLYICEEGTYRLALERSLAEQASDLGPVGPPHLWALQDLDSDGKAELVVSAPICGAHTCFEHVAILAWAEGAFEDHLIGPTSELPNPDVQVRDPDGDGFFELAVIGSGIDSVGAGPQRSLERVWRLDGGFWQMAGEVPGPSNYRIHALHDAQAAVQAGDDETALVLYERVIEDDTLEDWMEPTQERAVLSAYARFREIVIYSRLGQPKFADAVMDELEEAGNAGQPAKIYLALARTYLEGFARGGQAEGCAAGRSFARGHASVILEPLGPRHFGYGNRSFTVEDICPVSDPQLGHYGAS